MVAKVDTGAHNIGAEVLVGLGAGIAFGLFVNICSGWRGGCFIGFFPMSITAVSVICSPKDQDGWIETFAIIFYALTTFLFYVLFYNYSPVMTPI